MVGITKDGLVAAVERQSGVERESFPEVDWVGLPWGLVAVAAAGLRCQVGSRDVRASLIGLSSRDSSSENCMASTGAGWRRWMSGCGVAVLGKQWGAKFTGWVNLE